MMCCLHPVFSLTGFLVVLSVCLYVCVCMCVYVCMCFFLKIIFYFLVFSNGSFFWSPHLIL
jgi:hypothetical protein